MSLEFSRRNTGNLCKNNSISKSHWTVRKKNGWKKIWFKNWFWCLERVIFVVWPLLNSNKLRYQSRMTYVISEGLVSLYVKNYINITCCCSDVKVIQRHKKGGSFITIDMYSYTPVCLYSHIFIYNDNYKNICINTRHRHKHTHTHTHTHIYIYVCVCVCVCVREREGENEYVTIRS